ncbi:MAG: hypothetical protein CMQ05_00060 [Gammaproteobacteria bacterium]|uniref:Uncharacterized protein n=1 Tax=OM182 bacterium MED-G24 TaxID=1986255 RepID=A0A2A5WVK4_9GAMM|nr:hypothetical protein [Gammaproteobacteria bacterium]PDH40234.1 MAG: hypothetical protein CNE99_04005 [OM182 bacterium MED-G24]RPG23319.1 MAG: hypothetical protein CBC10_014945 [Gammaproteobacteria bacterium TMED50]|tara:strand:- start:663 stop:905 length:243 start_codon:yes stop_codon:yes gene_type:complete
MRDQRSADTPVVPNEPADTAPTNEALTRALDEVDVLRTELAGTLLVREELPDIVASEPTMDWDEDPQTIDEKVAAYIKLS